MPLEQLLQERRTEILRIAARHGVQRMRVFGSVARGDSRPDSDVDFLVVMDTNASSVERYAAVSAALRPRPFPVDIVVMTPAEVQQGLVHCLRH